MTQAYEVNFDGLIGPTHNYSGLAHGNVASMSHAQLISRPRDAVIQGLQKMKALHDMGLKQGILPPVKRPSIDFLRSIGFCGNTIHVLDKAYKQEPRLFFAAFSASSMWTANAATIAPSPDTTDRRVHLTAANLSSHIHRWTEHRQTEHFLRQIFHDESAFCCHDALPSAAAMSDEGAANHTRFCCDYGEPGIHLFTYGRVALGQHNAPRKFPARQTLESCHALTRLHQLKPQSVVYAQTHPDAIDAGVFHNDVISVGNRSLFFVHERAFVDTERVLDTLRETFQRECQGTLTCVVVPEEAVSLEDAVRSYLFNSQIVSLPDDETALILPTECQETPAVAEYLQTLQGGPLSKQYFFDVRQSMMNGGGPACLRLRVVLTEEELNKVHSGVLLDDALYQKLVQWAKRFYRETLQPDDLRDPALVQEVNDALNTLTHILELPSLY